MLTLQSWECANVVHKESQTLGYCLFRRAEHVFLVTRNNVQNTEGASRLRTALLELVRL
jgi:hypothetical protein